MKSWFVALTVVGLSLACSPQPPPKSQPSSLLGQRLPPFETETVSGKPLRSDSFARHPVVLSFVRTDCPACDETLKTVQAVFTDNERTVAWAIFEDTDPSKVQKLAAKLELEYPVVIDGNGRLQRLFVVSAKPTLVVLDSLGYVHWMGSRASESELAQLVRAAEHP
jgi:peroxiredoxin